MTLRYYLYGMRHDRYTYITKIIAAYNWKQVRKYLSVHDERLSNRFFGISAVTIFISNSHYQYKKKIDYITITYSNSERIKLWKYVATDSEFIEKYKHRYIFKKYINYRVRNFYPDNSIISYKKIKDESEKISDCADIDNYIVINNIFGVGQAISVQKYLGDIVVLGDPDLNERLEFINICDLIMYCI